MKADSNMNLAAENLGHSFMLLLQALSGIRGMTEVSIQDKDESVLLDDVLDVMAENLDFERCSIFLQNEDANLTCVAGTVWEDRVMKKPPLKHQSHVFRPGEGILGLVAQNRQTYHCVNCRLDKNYISIIDARNDKNAGSLICAPVLFGDIFLGVLNVSHPEPNFFHPWQEHIISLHAHILAQMIQNLRLVKDMESEVKLRTRELQDSLRETEVLKKKYEALSVVDDLTQIYNRRYFFNEVPAALSRAMRYNQALSLMFIDLDYFKSINDNYGHDVGDRVLQDVAAVLAQQSRKGDILARMGGEEFAIAVTNIGNNGIKLLAQRIKKAIADMSWTYDDSTFGVTLSMGISTINPPADNREIPLDRINETIQSLIREADQALYHSKNIGRDKITFFKDLRLNSCIDHARAD